MIQRERNNNSKKKVGESRSRRGNQSTTGGPRICVYKYILYPWIIVSFSYIVLTNGRASRADSSATRRLLHLWIKTKSSIAWPHGTHVLTHTPAPLSNIHTHVNASVCPCRMTNPIFLRVNIVRSWKMSHWLRECSQSRKCWWINVTRTFKTRNYDRANRFVIANRRVMKVKHNDQFISKGAEKMCHLWPTRIICIKRNENKTKISSAYSNDPW